MVWKFNCNEVQTLSLSSENPSQNTGKDSKICTSPLADNGSPPKCDGDSDVDTSILIDPLHDGSFSGCDEEFEVN